MTNFEVIKSWDAEHLAHFLSNIINACKYSDDIECALCTHCGDVLCEKESCISWLNSEVEE